LKTPDLNSLIDISLRLKAKGIVHALGGSGLLFAHGLVEEVGDWDLTTDASLPQVRSCLTGLDWEKGSASNEFRSDYLLRVSSIGTKIEIIGGFTILRNSKAYRILTKVNGLWNQIPLGDLKVWKRAYELMGRPQKAELIELALRKYEVP
jgi:hypothetical protein